MVCCRRPRKYIQLASLAIHQPCILCRVNKQRGLQRHRQSHSRCRYSKLHPAQRGPYCLLYTAVVPWYLVWCVGRRTSIQTTRFARKKQTLLWQKSTILWRVQTCRCEQTAPLTASSTASLTSKTQASATRRSRMKTPKRQCVGTTADSPPLSHLYEHVQVLLSLGGHHLSEKVGQMPDHTQPDLTRTARERADGPVKRVPT